MGRTPEPSLQASYFSVKLFYKEGAQRNNNRSEFFTASCGCFSDSQDLSVTTTATATTLIFKKLLGFNWLPSHFNIINVFLWYFSFVFFCFIFSIASFTSLLFGLIIRKIIMGSVMHIDCDIKLWHAIKFSRRCLDVFDQYMSSEHTILFHRTLEWNLFPSTVCHLNFTCKLLLVKV